MLRLPYGSNAGSEQFAVLKAALLFLLVILSASSHADPERRVPLSVEERAYLAQLGPVTVAPDPDWKPFEYIEADGSFTGIAADLLDLIAERLGIEFNYVVPSDWDEAIALSRSGQVLVLPFLNQTPAREEWLIFTAPLFVDPNVFITREEHPFIADARSLDERVMVLPSGTAIEERVRRDFPNLRIVTVPSERDVFRMLEERKADLTLRSLAVSAYTIRSEGWFNLRINGQAPQQYENRLRMGVLETEPMLRDILNKGIATITPQEREQIANRHINITVIQPFDYTYVLRIVAGILLVVSLVLLWNYRLRQLNRALAESERSKAVLLANLPGMAYKCRFDEKWTMQFVSEGCRELTGYEPQMLVNNREVAFVDLIDPAYRDYCTQSWAEARKTAQPAKLEYPINTADGKQKWVFEQGVVLEDARTGTFIEGLIIDITSRKQVENLRYHESTHDELTQLFNRRYMMRRLEDVLKRHVIDRSKFSVAMIDVDHFKRINDRHGHPAGDLVLREMAGILKRGFREQDLVGRYGGEEFIVIAVKVNREQTHRLFERLLEMIRNHQFEYEGQSINVTISAGIVNSEEPGLDFKLASMISLADRRLYEAKAGGRDRFSSFDMDAPGAE